jgi:hypothetical protein
MCKFDYRLRASPFTVLEITQNFPENIDRHEKEPLLENMPAK